MAALPGLVAGASARSEALATTLAGIDPAR